MFQVCGEVSKGTTATIGREEQCVIVVSAADYDHDKEGKWKVKEGIGDERCVATVNVGVVNAGGKAIFPEGRI